MSPLERAVDSPSGDTSAGELPPPEADRTPLEALERSLVPALESTPCVVSFSGGRDSSAVLAAAVGVARRLGLPLPVPVTIRVVGRPEADEAGWQELVIRHLGLEDWQIIPQGEELDLLGPPAKTALRRYGPLHPSQAFTQLPLFEVAASGSFLTGWDGDGLFGTWQYEGPAALLTRRQKPAPRDVLRLAKGLSPPPLRRRWLRRVAPSFPWLRPAAQAEHDAAWARGMALEPLRWDRRVAWYARRRAVHGVMDTAARLAAASSTEVFHPLLDPPFLSALAHAGGRSGLGGRTAVMRAVFGGVLPDEVLSRESKADFTLAYWGEHSREFARAWNGRGVAGDLVDPDALRKAWLAPVPHHASAALLQQAWLTASGGESEQPLDGAGER